MEANQRGRILEAVADVVGLSGYAGMSVEGIVTAAGVSRRTFYEHFNGKEDVFLAALDAGCGELLERVRRAADANETFEGSVRDCLATFVQFVAEDPRRAEMLIVEVLAAGPAAIRRRNALMTTLTEMLRRGGERAGNGDRPPGLTAETMLGGIYEVAYSRVLSGEIEQLPELVPDLAYSVMQAYVGHDRARDAATRPSAAVKTSSAT